MKNSHEQTNHGGTNITLAELSSRFWVLSAREQIRDWEKECTECRRRKAKTSAQIMGPLPDERIDQSVRAFTNTAVNYAGPLITKQGRGKTRLKGIFVCSHV